jgi:hypothetical protein
MLGMSRIWFPKDLTFKCIELEPDQEERICPQCGRFTYLNGQRHRRMHSLDDPLDLVSKVARCPDKGCPGHASIQVSPMEMMIAPPLWTVTWDLFAWMGHRRFARHWSTPQIRAELKDSRGIEVSVDLVEDYTAKYEVMVAARESDITRLVAAYQDVHDVILSIDGLQPEKGHETLYVVRELRLARPWFAEPLLSSAAGEVKRLFKRAHDLAARIGKPVRGWISDKQEAFVTGVQEVFPGVPHRYCANHFLRDAAKPVLEMDGHAKVQMRRKVRGLRKIERRMLADRGDAESWQGTDASSPVKVEEVPAAGVALAAAASPPVQVQAKDVSAPGQVVLDYCATVRGILNDDQGGPVHPPGVRMAEALAEVHESVGRARTDEKGGSTTTHSATFRPASSAALHW